MYVSDLALNDFRSYRQAVLQLPPGVVVFKGRNGRGKTNLVEAVGYLSTLSSHRVSADSALVRLSPPGEEPAKAAVVRAKVHDHKDNLLELEIVQGRANRARLNRIKVAPRELLGKLRTVTFAPEDLQLLRADPGMRRRFLDDIITQLKPSYLQTKRDLDKVLRQRASTLKQLAAENNPGLESTLEIWDQSLAALSARITAHRFCAVTSLAPLCAQAYLQVADDEKMAEVQYLPKVLEQTDRLDMLQQFAQSAVITDGYFPALETLEKQLEEAYLQAIALRRIPERRRGINLVGAHRDDFLAQIDAMPVRGYASHGETWSMVLALRLAQSSLFTLPESTPVLILDDVFAELDHRRRLALAEHIGSHQQVLVTTAIGSDVPTSLDVHPFEVDWTKQLGSNVSDSDE